MRRFRQRFAFSCAGCALVVAVILAAWALTTGSSEAQSGSMHNCPQAGKWAISVWDGPDGTETSATLAACGADAVDVAYALDPQTGGWLGWFRGRPEISKLLTLNGNQGVLALGSAAATSGSLAMPGATYVGTTSQDLAIELEVSADGLTIKNVTYRVSGTEPGGKTCETLSSSSLGSSTVGKSIVDNSFAIVHTLFDMSGHFDTQWQATGELTVHQPYADGVPPCDAGPLTWTATIPSATPTAVPAGPGQMHDCPQAGSWAISVWDGPDDTETGVALATCGAGTVAVAYTLDPQTGAWLGWFRGRPEISKLLTLDGKQGVLALGAMGAPPSTPTPTPTVGPCGSDLIQGIAYSPFRDGQDPNAGVYPTTEEIREDLTQLKSITDRIRTYGASGTLHSIAEEAAPMGISVAQGVFLSDDVELNEKEIASAVDLAERGLVQSVIVGNETVLTGVLSESQLRDYIRRVREAVPGTVAVTTAEPWSVWLAHPSLADDVDYILAHIHPFWEGQPVETAVSYVLDRYTEVRAQSGGKEVVIGETGWPSGGTSEQSSQPPNMMPSEANQRDLLEEFIPSASESCISYYLFSAYDEEWKWREGADEELPLPLDRTLSGRFVGSSWGIFASDGRIKPQLKALFAGASGPASRLTRTIFDDRGLAVLYDMGVDSSGQRRDWLEMTEGAMKMAYPAGQSWGAIFITVGPPADPPRPWKDFSPFRTLSVELRGKNGGESVEVGIKDSADPDNGSEAKTLIPQLSTEWQTYEFPLSSFDTADLGKLYVVAEFVFAGPTSQTVYFRNVRYLP